ncbi:hypothetical protein EBT31_07120 [bacterium]|nr:hypothetical protein [bacterium]NBX48727.1 hypothetical protein [bacterium]
MDPFALAAVVGLVFAGKKISDAKEEQAVMPAAPPPPEQTTKFDLVQYKFAQQDPPIDTLNLAPNTGRGFSGGFRLPPKDAVPNLQDRVPNGTRFPFGQPVYTVDGSREPVTNKMNNVPPAEKVYVGRGLGLDPDVPASGGFQQFFRILPNNVNEERLTNLPGNWGGPANPVVKNGGTTFGMISHPAKASKTATHEPMQTRGQGQGGAITGPEQRPDFQKSRRTTNRQETGYRKDGLEMGPGQYMVYEAYRSDTYTEKNRWSQNRINPDRAGNPGRMNVRADPVGAVGANTNTRLEAGALPVRPADASRGSRYIPNQYDRLNVFKGQKDPRSDRLNIAANVLKNNPFAHTFSEKPETGTPLAQPVN